MTAILSHDVPNPIARQRETARLLDGPPGVALAFFWGLGEATVFFVVPDVLISLAALLNPARVWRHVLAATAGALLGGLLLYSWSTRNGRNAQASIAHVPFVRVEMLAKVHASYERHGLGAMFLGPLTGIPYKIYAVEAPGFLNRNEFLSATVLARAERFLFVWALFGFAGSQLRKRFRTAQMHLLIVHACFWTALYGFYWGWIVLH